MQLLSPGQFKQILNQARAKGLTMRRRLIAYLLLMAFALIMAALLLLSLFGVLNPARSNVARVLDHQLETSVAGIEHDVDRMAAYALALSGQLSALVEKYQQDNGVPLEALKNHPEELAALQTAAFPLVYTNLQLAPCSGAFYLLYTTVNDTLPDEYHNGLYLKYANLYAENTINNKVCLFRGAASVARENNVSLHSAWQYEIKVDTFAGVAETLRDAAADSAGTYLLTAVYALPDTWENARFLCAPILDAEGRGIGVCGFEISDLYFELAYQTVAMEPGYTAFALLDRTEEGYTGQVAGNRGGYAPPVIENFSARAKGEFVSFQSGELSFVGKAREIAIGASRHTVAVMLPEGQYQAYLRDGQRKATSILCIIAVIAVCATLWLSKKYVAPILKSLQQIKDVSMNSGSSRIPEIDDLFEFLAQKDREHEDELRLLENQKQDAENEYAKAQTQLARLVEKKSDEIDPESYGMFLSNLHTLTPREREIFALYLEGKTAKEIHILLGVNENTVKFHNKNIYSKLGVASRKQLLQYATLMKQQEEGSADQ